MNLVRNFFWRLFLAGARALYCLQEGDAMSTHGSMSSLSVGLANSNKRYLRSSPLICFDAKDSAVLLQALLLVAYEILQVVGAPPIRPTHSVVGHMRERLFPETQGRQTGTSLCAYL
jgi:hypothetical protein